MEDIDDLELERRMRDRLLAPAKTTPEDERQTRMIAKLLGTTTGAEHFLRHERKKPAGDRIATRQKPYRPPEVRLRFEYWESGGWRIDRFENGKKIGTMRGSDFSKRDAYLIKLQAAGFTCTPITVADIEPRPVMGRARDKAKPRSQRMAVIGKLAVLDSDDVADFSADDYEDDV